MRAAGNMTDLRARQQNVGPFQQTARVWKLDQQLVIALKAFAHASELDQQDRQHTKPDEDERAYFYLQTFVAVSRRHFSWRV